MCVNNTGIFLDRPFQHWASIHGEDFRWLPYLGGRSERKEGVTKRLPRFEIQYHTKKHDPEATLPLRIWPEADRGGDSGLFAVFVGLGLGYDEIVLCGMPQDGSRHFFNSPYEDDEVFYKNWCTHHRAAIKNDYPHTHMSWRMAAPDMGGKVRSMSGFTRDLLGAP